MPSVPTFEIKLRRESENRVVPPEEAVTEVHRKMAELEGEIHASVDAALVEDGPSR